MKMLSDSVNQDDRLNTLCMPHKTLKEREGTSRGVAQRLFRMDCQPLL